MSFTLFIESQGSDTLINIIRKYFQIDNIENNNIKGGGRGDVYIAASGLERTLDIVYYEVTNIVKIDFYEGEEFSHLKQSHKSSPESFTAQALQSNSITFLRRLQSMAIDLKRENFKLKVFGSDPRRERLYDKALSKIGFNKSDNGGGIYSPSLH